MPEGGDLLVPIGPAGISRPGTDLSVFAYGMMHHYVLQAAEIVAAEGIQAEVIDLRTLLPIDRAAILASVRKTGKALIVHEDNRTGGYGAEIAAMLSDEAFTDLDAPVRRAGGARRAGCSLQPSDAGLVYAEYREDRRGYSRSGVVLSSCSVGRRSREQSERERGMGRGQDRVCDRKLSCPLRAGERAAVWGAECDRRLPRFRTVGRMAGVVRGQLGEVVRSRIHRPNH